VNLEGTSTSTAISTTGITTIHRSSLLPRLDRGQLDTFTVVHLTGTAQVVEF
jgi:hypothetical protein